MAILRLFLVLMMKETDKLVQLIDKKTSKNRNQYEDSIGVKDYS